MVNETIPTSIEGMDGQAIGQSNPLNLVNGETTQKSDAVPANGHKSIVDKIVGLIAKLSGNPDPFTGKESVSVGPKVEFQASTTTPVAEIKVENQTSTAPVQAETGGLFGKFTSTLGNLGNVVEDMGEKALGSATTAVNKGLEKAEQVGNQVVDKAQATVEDAAKNVSNTLTDAVKLDDSNTSTTQTEQVGPGPDYFFPPSNEANKQ